MKLKVSMGKIDMPACVRIISHEPMACEHIVGEQKETLGHVFTTSICEVRHRAPGTKCMFIRV